MIIFIQFSLLCVGNNKNESIFSADLLQLRVFCIKKDSAYSPPKVYAPFQGKKVFCSTEYKQKVFVTINGNNVNIVIGKKKMTGIYKKSEVLLTNDPKEIEYRKNAPGKYHYGSYYVIGKDYFSVLLGENGEYSYYSQCS